MIPYFVAFLLLEGSFLVKLSVIHWETVWLILTLWIAIFKEKKNQPLSARAFIYTYKDIDIDIDILYRDFNLVSPTRQAQRGLYHICICYVCGYNIQYIHARMHVHCLSPVQPTRCLEEAAFHSGFVWSPWWFSRWERPFLIFSLRALGGADFPPSHGGVEVTRKAGLLLGHGKQSLLLGLPSQEIVSLWLPANNQLHPREHRAGGWPVPALA